MYEGCGKGFVTLYHLNRHTLIHTGEKPYKCEAEDCDLAFTTATNMKLHFKRAHSSPTYLYVCHFADCGQQFRKHNQLKIHQYIHTNQLPFKCSHEGCDKSYGSPSRLKRHEKVHAGYPCRKDATCPFVGQTWSDYLKHAAAVHSEVTCNVCNRAFKKNSNLKDHKRTHKDETTVYQCPREDCDRTYTTKFNLRSHILSFHENLRPFVCEHEGCGKTFPMKQSLDRHANTHDPEKKKMVKPPRPKRSLASRLSGYKPKKKSSKKRASTPAAESLKQPLPSSQPDPTPVLENLSLK
ncbi:transcription factor IIIA isoform X2 [Eleutherodactylus coqui]